MEDFETFNGFAYDYVLEGNYYGIFGSEHETLHDLNDENDFVFSEAQTNDENTQEELNELDQLWEEYFFPWLKEKEEEPTIENKPIEEVEEKRVERKTLLEKLAAIFLLRG